MGNSAGTSRFIGVPCSPVRSGAARSSTVAALKRDVENK